MKKLFSMKDEMFELLGSKPRLRDNDEMLMATMWFKHMGKKLEDMSAFDLLRELAYSGLPSYESISRCRRKLQELHPNLRGEKWEQRHKRAKTIKKEIAGVSND